MGIKIRHYSAVISYQWRFRILHWIPSTMFNGLIADSTQSSLNHVYSDHMIADSTMNSANLIYWDDFGFYTEFSQQ